MTCPSCEQRISDALMKVDGIIEARADYASETTRIIYDESRIDLIRIEETVEGAGYKFSSDLKKEKIISWKNSPMMVNILLCFLLIIYFIILLLYFIYGKNLNGLTLVGSISIPILFVFGLVTGLHCIGMCGSFMVAYSSKNGQRNEHDWLLHIKYGSGKLLSYTLIGGIFGLLGSVISFTIPMRGAIGIFAGVFLIIYGLNLLNVSPALRKLRLPSLAKMGRTQRKDPFVIGLANGLFLACGPLSAMYIFAAGTGSPVNGAVSLFAFGLGTIPAMMFFGFSLSSIKRYIPRIIKFSGAFVIVLGLVMANNSLVLLGGGINMKQADIEQSFFDVIENVQTIKMNVNESGWSPDTFVLKKGIKVRWIIDGTQLNGCNDEIIVNDYGMEIDVRQGKNIVEFTPEKEGTVKWSCGMGMNPGTFIIK